VQQHGAVAHVAAREHVQDLDEIAPLARAAEELSRREEQIAQSSPRR
jgi:hypothetical protein